MPTVLFNMNQLYTSIKEDLKIIYETLGLVYAYFYHHWGSLSFIYNNNCLSKPTIRGIIQKTIFLISPWRHFQWVPTTVGSRVVVIAGYSCSRVGEGGMLVFLLFLHCHSLFPIIFLCFFLFLIYKPFYSMPFFLGDDTEWLTVVDMSLNNKYSKICFHREIAGLSGSVRCTSNVIRRLWVRFPLDPATLFHGDWSWNVFYGHSLPSADSRRAVVSLWQKNVHMYWLTT